MRRSWIGCCGRHGMGADGVPWLDAARYADSNGYQTDGERFMWRWRDWVIDAFNRNMPYDQFTIEQLAGDLLPNATLSQKIATAFNRNHRGNSKAASFRMRRRIRRRSRGHDVHGVPGSDVRLRALPQPQVRSHHAEGVLPAVRLLQQRARARKVPARRQLAAAIAAPLPGRTSS